ncbi:MAG: NrdH-redoxin [Desulfuromonadales bacterium]|nr:NrdH-redoxin [Desulfuromonadales bacterium]
MLRTIFVVCVLLLITIQPGTAADQAAPRSSLDTVKAAEAKKYPSIVLYSVSWCPHCRAAKNYLTSRNIPFVNRDVEIDSSAMNDLNKKYESEGVPVIVLGEGEKEVVLRGFSPEAFQEKLKLFPSGK